MIRKANIVKAEGLAGGKGTAEIHHIVTAEELGGAGRMYAKVALKPGASVGWHRHTGETEPYYILSGNGIFTDDDGTKSEVGCGDCCVINAGQCHSIENNSETEDLVFMALIHNVFQ